MATLYVSTTGSDAAAGTIGAPFATVTHAANVATAGSSVFVRAGTYSEAVTVGSSRDGTSGSPIVYAPFTGETVIFDGSALAAGTDIISIFADYITFTGFEIRNAKNHGVMAYDTHGVVISNNVIHGCIQHGIWAGGELGASSNTMISGNTVYDCCRSNVARSGGSGWGQGIGVNFSDGSTITGNTVYKNYGEGIGAPQSSGVTISHNVAYDNYSINIYLDNSPLAVVDSNLTYSSGDTGYYHGTTPVPSEGIGFAIETVSSQRPLTSPIVTNNISINDLIGIYYGNYGTGGGIQNGVFANNTVVNPYSSGKCVNFDADAGHSGNVFRNNIVYRSPAGTLITGTTTGFTFDHNCWFGTTPTGSWRGTGDVVGDPILINPGTFVATDYKLSTASPVKSAGTTIATVTTDYSGATRTAPYSMGAFGPPAAALIVSTGYSDYAWHKIFDHSVGKTAWTMPTAYMALFTTLPKSDGTGGVEVSGGSYARVTTSGATWNAAGGSAPSFNSNAATISFPLSTASWGAVCGWGIMDAVSGGNQIFADFLGASLYVPFTCTSASPGILTIPAHGFSNGDTVIVTSDAGTLPATSGSWGGLLTVAGVTTDTFNVGVNTTSSGSGMLRKVATKTVGAGVTPSWVGGAPGAFVLRLA